MKRLLNLCHKYLRYRSRTLLLLDTAFNVMFIIFFLPFLNHGIEYVMKIKGLSYITEENAVGFLTFPPALLLFLLVLLFMPVILLIKLSAIIYYCNTESSLHKPTLLKIIYYGFFKTLHLLRKGNIALSFFTVVIYLYTNLPLICIFIVFSNPGSPGSIQDEVLIKGMILLALLLLGFVYNRSIFTLPYCMNEHLSFSEGLKRSKALLRGRGKRTLFIITIYNTGLLAGFFLLYYAILLISALFVYLFASKSMAVTVFLSVYPGINFYSTLFFSMIAFIVNINLIYSLFWTYQEESLSDILPEAPKYPIPFHKKQHKLAVYGFLLYISLLGMFNFYLTVHNDTLYLSDALSGIRISSHRGNSFVSPENTLPAIENAIQAESDYAEIDVQQTKDGVLILLHDASLWRTAGINRFIWDMTKREIDQLDVGSWFGNDYINTKIPTLEEVLIHCKNKIKLNIEIKVSGKVVGLEEKLAALIEKYNYEHQCIVSSANYSSLIKIKQRNEKIKTGYILSAAYGYFYDKDDIDFFSIRSSFINKNVVKNAHSAGKEVHAWTVNTPKEIERMKSVGVDCIITDNPTLAREIIYRNDTNANFIQLLRRMMKNRTLNRMSLISNQRARKPREL